MPSFQLDPVAFEGLLRVVDHLLPPGGPFPPVRQVVRREDAAVSIGAVPVGDRNALVGLLKLFRWVPRRLVIFPMALVLLLAKLPGGAGAPFRLLAFGLEGLAYTLYFSAPAVLAVLRWDADVKSEARLEP